MNSKKLKVAIFSVVFSSFFTVGCGNQGTITEKAEEIKTEVTEKVDDVKIALIAKKTMTDLRESRLKHSGEHTDRNEFDNLLWTIRPSASVIHLDPMLPVEEMDANYPKEVFFRYTGIENVDKIKFVSSSGPSWENEYLVQEPDDIYSTEKFFSVLVLANNEEDAKIVLEQMKKNLKPWDWTPGDYVASDEDGSYLAVDIPNETHAITEENMNFYRNGEYILFTINDAAAVEAGTQESMEYITKLLDEAIEVSKEYYASQE